MEDGYRLIDYGINLNDVIQLMVRAEPLPVAKKTENEGASDDESKEEDEEEAAKENKPKKNVDESLIDTTCDYYEVS